jgi:hypothetical protein
MELILEILLEPIVEVLLRLWSKIYNNPDYDNSHLKKVLTIIVGVVLALVTTAIILLGILYLIEWQNPSLFDVVGLD